MTIAHIDGPLREWEAFQTTGKCDEAIIAPPIARSWQRCGTAGIDARQPRVRLMGSGGLELEAGQSALAALARPYMEDLYQFVEGSGFAVLLLDAALVVVEVIGDAPMVAELQMLGLQRGASLH